MSAPTSARGGKAEMLRMAPIRRSGSLGVFVQGAGFILLNPDANQLTRDIMPLGKRVQALPGNELLRDLPLELMLWERCLAMAFIL